MEFTLERCLGEGSFGQVWLARDLRTGRRVAVKYLKSSKSALLKRFAREVRVLIEQRSNPHVVTIYGHDLTADRPFLVTEYCEFGSLRSWVGKRNWRTITRAILHAAMGLEGIHAQGGFHRDLKPDNLLATKQRDGTCIVKVADFGLARLPSRRTAMTYSAHGTDGYIAPEVRSGSAKFATCSDVYSLGVTAIELLTGSRRGMSNSLAVASAPQSLKHLFARMIDVFPSRRPSMSDVIIELKLIASQQQRRGSDDQVNWIHVAAGLGLLLACTGRRDRRWDSSADRYRASDGRFCSG